MASKCSRLPLKIVLTKLSLDFFDGQQDIIETQIGIHIDASTEGGYFSFYSFPRIYDRFSAMSIMKNVNFQTRVKIIII